MRDKFRIYEEPVKGIKKLRIKKQVYKPSGKKSWKRYPIQNYKHIEDNRKLLSELVDRLNDECVEKKYSSFELESSFLPKNTLINFFNHLAATSNSKSDAINSYNSFYKYAFTYLVKKSPNPKDWKKDYLDCWTKSLLNDDDIPESDRLFKKGHIPSKTLLKRIIRNTNKFLMFIFNKGYINTEIVLSPISKSQFKYVIAERSQKNLVKVRNYIDIDDLYKILNSCDQDIIPNIKLSLYYGLRLSETIGLFESLENIRHGFLLINRQISHCNNGIPRFKPTKSKKPRKIPHWFCKQEDCYDYIKQLKLMSHNTLSRKYSEICLYLYQKGLIKHHYNYHDLRHTYITNSARKHTIRDVQLAAGHSDIQTTNKYLKDDRDLENQIWKPSV
ncbi:tyrosine-type recombinase/integrase [Bacteriovoracaceae bacterium]|nr:tyrosine-type recombinase/integrase [Bacteriovoracaceae bacterium]